MATQSPPVDDVVAAVLAAFDTQLVVHDAEHDRPPTDDITIDATATVAGAASNSTIENTNTDPVDVDSVRTSQLQQLQQYLAAERDMNGRLLQRLSDQKALLGEQQQELQRRTKVGDELRKQLAATNERCLDLDEAQAQAKQFRQAAHNAKRKLANALKAHNATAPLNGSSVVGDGKQNNANAALTTSLKAANDQLRKLRGQCGYAYKRLNAEREDIKYWANEADTWQTRCEREATERMAAERLVTAMQVLRIDADGELAEALHQRRLLQKEVELLKSGAASNSDKDETEVEQAAVVEANEVPAAVVSH